MGARNAANRLTFDDDLFLRMWQLAGISFNSQGIWRFPGVLEDAEIHRLHAQLARGPLGKLILPPRVFGARNSFVADHHPAPPRITQGEVEDVAAWIDALSTTDLDPVAGPGFVLHAARTVAGETLIGLVVNHALADGTMMNLAEICAARNESPGRLPDDSLAAAHPTLRDDLADAWHQLKAAGRGLGPALRMARGGGFTNPAAVEARNTGGPKQAKLTLKESLKTEPWLSPMVAVDVTSEEWKQAAAARGGTQSTLFTAIQIGLAEAFGAVREGDEIPISIPMALRQGDADLRANTTSAGVLRVKVDSARYQDLTALRSASREMYRHASSEQGKSRLDPLKPLMQLTPNWLASLAMRSAPAALVTASNLGQLAPEQETLGTRLTANGVLGRGATHPMTAEFMRASGGALAAWCCEGGGTASTSIQSMNPDAVADRDQLQAIVAEEYSRWGLTPRFW